MKPPYPVEALGAMLRASDARAVRYVVSELRRCEGNVRETARAIGCSERALYTWRDASAALKAAFAEHAMGRAGAGPNAARARQAAEDAEDRRDVRARKDEPAEPWSKVKRRLKL